MSHTDRGAGLGASGLGISGRIAAFFQNNSLTPLLALVALLLGVFATLVTPREEEPQIDVTMADVLIAFPGASAKDVEHLIATPAEQVFSRMAGVEHVFSVAKPGMAVVTVQFEVGVKQQTALVRLYDTVHSNSDWLPANLGVAPPVVKAKGIDDVPIVGLTFATADPARSAYDLQQVSRAVETEVKRIAGTRDVSTIGGPEPALRVELDPERMAVAGVTVSDLRNALLAANAAAQPAGSVVSGSRELWVQAGTFLNSVDDVARVVVAVRGDKPVFLADVAKVSEGPDRPKRYAWIGFGPATAGAAAGELPAVTLQISKKPGVNAADVADAVLSRIEALKGTVIPDGVSVTVSRNYGATATDKAKKLIGKLVFATSAVVLLVFFTLGKREALVVGVAVSLTLAATLFASWAWGFTLNRVSLFALIFSIGILVDDAIVVVENIHRWHVLHPEKTMLELIPGAVDEVGGPTILATLTVIAALLPMAFVTGLMGPYMSPIPINSSLGMLISLAIAFTVTPWLARRLLGQHIANHGPSKLDSKLDAFFRRTMLPFLESARARRKLALGVAIALLVAVALPVLQLVVLKMLPFDNKSEFQVVLDMPVGTPVEETATVLHELGAEVAKVEEVTDYQAYAGTASPINFNGLVRQYYLRSFPEQGDLQVNLVSKAHRSRSSHEIASSLRATLAEIGKRHGGNVKVVEVPPGPPVLSPIVAEVYGPNYAGQQAVAKQVRAAFEGTPDLVGVDDSVDADAKKIVLRVNQTKAALLGVAQSEVVDAIRTSLAGEDTTPMHDRDAKFELPIRLTLPAERQGDLAALMKLRLRARDGRMIPVADLVQVSEAWREKTIFHKDLLPVVYVVADQGGKLDSPLYGMFGARSRLAGKEVQAGGQLGETFISQPSDPYAGFAIKWDGEWQVTYETFRDMGAAYGVGLILIYLLVVAHFGSYLVPLVIMAPIPLTVIGVMPGHALLGSQYTATSMIGMIALAGIIVRNSILLVDFIREQVAAGMNLKEATVRSAAVRAKPIALTAAAAMTGALFILDDPIFNGLAISLIFGILVSTLLTLVVIPVLYYNVMNKPSENQA
jgi:multidrug efflux pump subunit AcrB